MEDIEQFYRGKSVFVTGGTGFVGKAFIEKILRSCPEVGDIYLLCRRKTGLDVQSRIDKLLNGPVSNIKT